MRKEATLLEMIEWHLGRGVFSIEDTIRTQSGRRPLGSGGPGVFLQGSMEVEMDLRRPGSNPGSATHMYDFG